MSRRPTRRGWDAATTAAAVAGGEVSAREVTQAHLDRIGAVDAAVHAFLHVDADGALAAARAVDDARAPVSTLGPLAGVPLALKDIVCTQGRADHLRVAHPRGLASAVRRHRHGPAARPPAS